MLTSYAIALTAMAVLCAAWLGVQLAWRRVFPPEGGDPDALAGRLGCRGCDCTVVCEKRAAATNAAREEERT